MSTTSVAAAPPVRNSQFFSITFLIAIFYAYRYQRMPFR